MICPNIMRVWQPCVATEGLPAYALKQQSVFEPMFRPSRYSAARAEENEIRLFQQPVPVQLQQGLFVLPPKSERYLLGLLVETDTTGPILGLTRYMSGGHNDIAIVISLVFGPIRTILWGGELCLENPHDFERKGILRSYNNTSGFLHQLAHPLSKPPDFRVDNQSKNLMNKLKLGSPFDVPPNMDLVSYDSNNQHLYVGLNDSGIAGINFRHDLSNALDGARVPMELIKGGFNLTNVNEVKMTFEEVREDIEILKQFCDLLLETNPFDQSVLMTLSQGLSRVLAGETLSPDTYQNMVLCFDKLLAFFNVRMVADRGNDYDLVSLAA